MMLPRFMNTLRFKYDVLMPLLAKLPQHIAYRIASLYARRQLAGHEQEIEVITRQMQVVFTEQDISELQEWARYYFSMYDRDALDTWFFQKLHTRKQIESLVKLQGFEQVLNARKAGKRVMISSGHFSRFWMAGVAMKAQGVSVGTITRDGGEFNRQGLDEAEFQYRKNKLRWLQERFGGPFLVEGDSARPIYKALDHHVMAVFIDVPYEQKKTEGIKLKFLGKTAQFPVGAARIAKRTGALIVPFYVTETREGLNAQFYQPVDAAAMDEQEIMRHLVSVLESHILKYPQQWWLWQALPQLWV